MKKFRKANIKRITSAAVVSALIASGLGYTFVSSAANTITLASSGRFEYDADGNGTINGAAGDIILDSDDLVALKDAVTGLNSSLTAISTKAYGADGVPNYTGQLKDASGNLISGDPDDLESKYYSYQTSHSYTNTQYEEVNEIASNSLPGVYVYRSQSQFTDVITLGEASGIELSYGLEYEQQDDSKTWFSGINFEVSDGVWNIQYSGEYNGNGKQRGMVSNVTGRGTIATHVRADAMNDCLVAVAWKVSEDAPENAENYVYTPCGKVDASRLIQVTGAELEASYPWTGTGEGYDFLIWAGTADASTLSSNRGLPTASMKWPRANYYGSYGSTLIGHFRGATTGRYNDCYITCGEPNNYFSIQSSAENVIRNSKFILAPLVE